MEKILIIAAHPDDEVLGAGGAIVKHVENGNEVSLLIVTDGSTSQYKDDPKLLEIIEEKKKETESCARTLGIKNVYYGDLPDMKLDSIPHIDINNVIENVIDEVNPSIVYTHFYGDVNKDHRCVYESTLVACRPTQNQIVKRIFLYYVPSSTEWNLQIPNSIFMPNWYEKLTEREAEIKYDAFKCYKEELREYPHPRSIEYLRNLDVSNGNKIGAEFAECFMLVRNIVD